MRSERRGREVGEKMQRRRERGSHPKAGSLRLIGLGFYRQPAAGGHRIKYIEVIQL